MASEMEILIARLHAEVDKKCQSQHRAIDELAADLLRKAPAQLAGGSTVRSGEEGSRVGKVLFTIRDSFKSVAEIAGELDLSEPNVRAVLYSKSVRKRVESKKRDKKQVFKAKAPAESAESTASHAANGETPTTAARVRNLLRQHPSGLSHGAIVSGLRDTVDKTNTISTAIYRMKERGAIEYNEALATYRLAAGK